MKKFLAILILGLILFVNQTKESFAMEYGFGELKLSNQVVNAFIKFIKGRNQNSPYLFSVAIDGLQYQYYICPGGLNNCQAGNHTIVNKDCEKYSRQYGSGAKCAVFAHFRTIKWNNGINKSTKIKSKWSEQEIRAKLKEIGFLGGEPSSTKTNKGNTVEQLEALTGLFESGALTEEEFKSAKKKVLND